MKLSSTLRAFLTLTLTLAASTVLGAAVERDLNVVERASNPSVYCIEAEKYLGINNNIYSAACAELVSPFSDPCTYILVLKR